MFTAGVDAVPYADPWLTPLPGRIAHLERGTTRVAYYCRQTDSSSFRYRAYNMIQALEAHDPGVAASYFTGDEIVELTELAGQLDALVLCRVPYTDQVAHLIARARTRDRPVLYDIDDLVFDIDYVPDLVHAIDDDIDNERIWDARFALAARNGAAMRLCTGAIATSRHLARLAADFSGLPCHVVPNFLNREQLDVSDRIADAKQKNDYARDGTTTIGYFSGSPTHEKDFAIAAKAIADLMNRRADVRLRLVGHVRDVASWRAMGDRIEKFPMEDYLNLQRLIGEVEFSIAPLQTTQFSHCKSELKYFEAAAVGTLTIASPTPVFREAIRPGETGFLAGGAGWPQALETAIRTLDDYAAFAGRARDDARTRYSWSRQGPEIRRILLG